MQIPFNTAESPDRENRLNFSLLAVGVFVQLLIFASERRIYESVKEVEEAFKYSHQISSAAENKTLKFSAVFLISKHLRIEFKFFLPSASQEQRCLFR